MGVRGLVKHCSTNVERAASTVDLVEVTRQYQRDGLSDSSGRIVLAVDFYSFAVSFLSSCEHAVLAAQSKEWPALSPHTYMLGGEPRCYDHWMEVLITKLRAMGVELVFFADGARGSHPDEFGRKLETLKARDLQMVAHANAVKAFCDSGRPLSGERPWSGMRVVRRQLLLTARRLGVHWVQCLGEADEEIVRYAHAHREVFAIVSTDSDFLVTPGCRVILPSFVDWVPLTSSDWRVPDAFPVPVFSAASVAASLELPEASLPALAALCGNDIMRTHLERHKVHHHLKLPTVGGAVATLQAAAELLRSLDGQDLRRHPFIGELLESDGQFAEALAASLLFYSAGNAAADKQPRWSLSPGSAHPSPQAFVAFLLNAVETCALSPSVLAVACSGVYWRDAWLEDLAVGQPRIVTLTQSLRLYLHALVRQASVDEYGRQDRRDFGVEKVTASRRHLKVPCVDEACRLPLHERVAWFWKITSHILEPNMTLDARVQSTLQPLTAIGAKPSEADRHAVETILVVASLRYFASLNGKMLSRTAQKRRLRRSELDSVVAMWLALRDDGTGSVAALPSTLERPSMRCVTVGQWYSAVLLHCTELAARLRLSHFFPEVKDIYSGSLWAALYAAAEAPAEKLAAATPQQQGWFDTVRSERARLLDAPAGASVRDTIHSDLPHSIWPAASREASSSASVTATKSSSDSKEPAAVTPLPKALEAQPPSPPAAISPQQQQQEQQQQEQQQQQQPALPIAAHRERIMEQIRRKRVTCIQGETGCGKSTSVPLYIYEDWMQRNGGGKNDADGGDPGQPAPVAHVVVTQPRRVAAIMLARHVAKLHGEPIGQTIGYSVSRDVMVSKATRVTFMTIGYLLQVLVNQPSVFSTYTHVVLDEVHERSADADLLSLVIRRLMRRYSGTKLVVMSATLQADLFALYFTSGLYPEGTDERDMDVAPTLFVGVKRFGVREVYLDNLVDYIAEAGSRPNMLGTLEFGVKKALRKFDSQGGGGDRRGGGRGRNNNNDDDTPLRAAVIEPLTQVCVNVILQCAQPGQCILVFVAGLGNILELHELLSKHTTSGGLRVFGLHSLMPRNEQEEAFQAPPADAAHVVLATNIAESSLTLPEVACVIDFGLQKEVVFDTRSKRCCLVHSWCSRASAAQRAGRTGRVRLGTVVRLYSENFYRHVMSEFDSPEIVRLPLDKLVLQVRQLGDSLARDSGDGKRPTPSQLLQEAVQPPSTAQLQAALESLAEVGALTAPDEEARITSLGRIGLGLPVDLSVARFLLVASVFGYAADGVIVAAGLSAAMDVMTLPSHLVMGTGVEYVDSLWRSLCTRFRFDARQYCEPLMVWRLFREWLRHRHRAIQRLAAGDKFNRVAAAQRFCATHAVSWQRLMTLESLVIDIASRLASALPRDSPSIGALRWLASLSQQQASLASAAGKSAAAAREPDPDVRLTGDADGLRCALVASFSFNILAASSLDISDGGGASNQLRRQRKDTTEVAKQRMQPHKTVIANNVPRHLRCDGGQALLAALPRRIGHNAKVRLMGDKAFVQCADDSDEDTPDTSDSLLAASPFGAAEPFFAGMPRRGHLLCQLGGGRNRCMLMSPAETTALTTVTGGNAAAPSLRQGRPAARAPPMSFDSVAMDNSVTINRRNQPCHVKWRLVTGSGASEVLCSWRNPIGNARNGGYLESEESFAVAAAIQGTERPGAVHASGVTVLPTELGGRVARFLLLLFLPHSQKVEFQLDVRTGDLHALRSGQLRLQFEPPLADELVREVSSLRHDISACLDDVGSMGRSGGGLQGRLAALLRRVRSGSDDIGRADGSVDRLDGGQMSRRKERKVSKAQQKALKWVTVQQCSTLVHIAHMSADTGDGNSSGGSGSAFQVLPAFQLDGVKRALAASASVSPVSGMNIDFLLENGAFQQFLLELGSCFDTEGSRLPLKLLRQDGGLQSAAHHARNSLRIDKKLNLLSMEFLATIPELVQVQGTSNKNCVVSGTSALAQIVDDLLDYITEDLDPWDPWRQFDPDTMLYGSGDDDEQYSSSDWDTCDGESDDELDGNASRTPAKRGARKPTNAAAAPPLGQRQTRSANVKKKPSGASPAGGGKKPAQQQQPPAPQPQSAKKKLKAKKSSSLEEGALQFTPFESQGFYGKRIMRKLERHVPESLLCALHSAIVGTTARQRRGGNVSGTAEVDMEVLISDKGVVTAAARITDALTAVPDLRPDVRPLTPTFIRSMFGSEMMCSRREERWSVEHNDEELDESFDVALHDSPLFDSDDFASDSDASQTGLGGRMRSLSLSGAGRSKATPTPKPVAAESGKRAGKKGKKGKKQTEASVKAVSSPSQQSSVRQPAAVKSLPAAGKSKAGAVASRPATAKAAMPAKVISTPSKGKATAQTPASNGKGGGATPAGKSTASPAGAAPAGKSTASPAGAAQKKRTDRTDVNYFIEEAAKALRECGGVVNLSQLCGLPRLREIALHKPFIVKNGQQVLKLKFFEKHPKHFRVERRDGQVFVRSALKR